MKSASNGKTVQNCPACKGSGTVNGQTACPMCDGNGQVVASPFRQPFAYVFNGVVPANGTLPVMKQISAESDFEWVFTLANFTSGSMTVVFKDSSSNIQFTSDPIQIGLFSGTAQLPFPVWLGDEPYLFGASSVLEADFTDTSGAPNTVQLVLWGFKRVRSTPQNSPSQQSSSSSAS